MFACFLVSLNLVRSSSVFLWSSMGVSLTMVVFSRLLQNCSAFLRLSVSIMMMLWAWSRGLYETKGPCNIFTSGKMALFHNVRNYSMLSSLTVTRTRYFICRIRLK